LRPGDSATGTENDAVPVAVFALKVSPMPRIAPPPFGISGRGAELNSSLVLAFASTGAGRPSGRTTARSRAAGAETPVPPGGRGELGPAGRSAIAYVTTKAITTSSRLSSVVPEVSV
jgi:hypothetical protein